MALVDPQVRRRCLFHCADCPRPSQPSSSIIRAPTPSSLPLGRRACFDALSTSPPRPAHVGVLSQHLRWLLRSRSHVLRIRSNCCRTPVPPSGAIPGEPSSSSTTPPPFARSLNSAISIVLPAAAPFVCPVSSSDEVRRRHCGLPGRVCIRVRLHPFRYVARVSEGSRLEAELISLSIDTNTNNSSQFQKQRQDQ